jgi:Tfp pilus assembly protein PilO
METLLKQLEPRTAIILMISAVLLITTALGTYVIWPGVKQYRSSLATRDVLEQVSHNGQGLEAQIATLSEEVKALSHELHGDLANLPDNQMEAFIIGRLQGISWRNNIELQSVRPGKGNIIKVFEEIVFNVEITGDYFDLYAWLQDLGEELGFVVIKHFSIRPLDKSTAESRLTADLTIVSYREVNNA